MPLLLLKMVWQASCHIATGEPQTERTSMVQALLWHQADMNSRQGDFTSSCDQQRACAEAQGAVMHVLGWECELHKMPSAKPTCGNRVLSGSFVLLSALL